MTGFKTIFLDTSQLIYYLQESELYYSHMVHFWRIMRYVIMSYHLSQ